MQLSSKQDCTPQVNLLQGRNGSAVAHHFGGSIQRILSILIGGMLVYFGYRLFLSVPGKHGRDGGSGEFSLGQGSKLKLSKVGAGVFGSMLTDMTAPVCGIMLVCPFIRQWPRLALSFPRSFKLGIPDNARDESAVSNRSDWNFGNTIVLLLVHELGHALKKHPTDLHNLVEKRKQEVEADALAIEMMRRIGQVPVGIEFWFDVEHTRAAENFYFIPTEVTKSRTAGSAKPFCPNALRHSHRS